MDMTLGCKSCVDALTQPSSLCATSEDPKGMLVRPQIPLLPLIFSTVYANEE